MTWKIIDNDEGKLTPKQIAEAIARLDGPELAAIGDELAVMKLAQKVAFLCNVSLQEEDRRKK